jgi:hypothetical protein
MHYNVITDVDQIVLVVIVITTARRRRRLRAPWFAGVGIVGEFFVDVGVAVFRDAAAIRVGKRSRVVVGVGVAVPLPGVGEVLQGVDGDEPAGGGVVFAGAEVDQAGGVFGAADEAALDPARPLAGCRVVCRTGSVCGVGRPGWWR